MALSTLHEQPAEACRKDRSDSAEVSEVFSSIQGEGLHAGKRHIFVRFCGCNLNCIYCDTRQAMRGRRSARLEQTPGAGDFRAAANPMSCADVAASIRLLARAPHDAVSFTGGEPLLHDAFIGRLAPGVHALGLKTYLETNGTLPDNLARVLDQIDIIAMDIKLPQTQAAGRDLFSDHSRFLRVASATGVFCKLVVPPVPDLVAVARAARMVAEVSEDIPLVLQPVTPTREVERGPSPSELTHCYEAARQALKDVRVIPQTHRFLGLR